MEHKTITLHQPWASFIAFGIKRYETRSWHPGKRVLPGEVLLIHAAKRPIDYQGQSLIDWWNEMGRHMTQGKFVVPSSLEHYPLGAIVCSTRLVKVYDAHELNMQYPEARFGNFGLKRYAWELELIDVPAYPIPASGRQGIWKFEYEAVE